MVEYMLPATYNLKFQNTNDQIIDVPQPRFDVYHCFSSEVIRLSEQGMKYNQKLARYTVNLSYYSWILLVGCYIVYMMRLNMES